MAELPDPPKFTVRGSTAMQRAFDSISNYFKLLRERDSGSAKRLLDMLQPGPGIAITSDGNQAMFEVRDYKRFKQSHFRFFVENPEQDVYNLVVGPGILFGGKSDSARTVWPYWPGFHSDNASDPGNTSLPLSDGSYEIWGKVTATCPEAGSGVSVGSGEPTFKTPVVISEFDVVKFEGVYTEGISAALMPENIYDSLSDIGANVPDDDPDEGVFYFYIGCVKKEGSRIHINQTINEPVWWWMVCDGFPSGSSVLSFSDPSPSNPSGSSKIDSAIVPDAYSPTGNSALYVLECPGVKFADDGSFEITKRRQRFELSHRFLSLCEREGMNVVVSGDTGWAAGYIRAGSLVITVSRFPWCRPKRVSFWFIATRKGHKEHLEPKTDKERELNAALIKWLREGGVGPIPR